MDGSGVTSFKANGGGKVNCQYTAGPYETFRLVPQSDGSVSIASVTFPNVFLRMDGRGVTSFSGNGGGTVNCQYGTGSWQSFFLVSAPPPPPCPPPPCPPPPCPPPPCPPPPCPPPPCPP